MKKIILTFVLLIVFVVNAQNQSSKDNQSRFSIIPSIGYAWRTAETPSNISSDVKNMIEQIKKGTNIEIIGLYRLNNNNTKSHIGLKYNRYSASANGSVFDGSVFVNVQTDDVISYFGPVYAATNVYNSGELYFDVSLGYINYKSTSISRGTGIVEGNNLGFSAGISYFFKISPVFSLGPNLNITTGTLNEITISDGRLSEVRKLNDEEKEGLGRISLNLQAKFNF